MSRQRFRHFRSLSLFVVPLVASLVAWDRLPAQDEEDPVAIRDYNTAAELQNSGLYSQAGEKWKQFIASHKDYNRIDRAVYNVGVCCLHTKKYDEAIKSFTETAAKYPQFESLDALRYNLGMAHLLKGNESKQAGDYTNAAKAFGEAAAKHPQSKYADRALYFQGEAYFTAGALEESRKAFAGLVSKYPQSALLPDAYYALGTAQQQAGQFDEAIKTYNAFLAHNDLKNHEFANEVRLRLGMSLYETGNFAEAEKHFEQVAGEKEFALADFALLRQAQCRYEQNDIAKAAELNQSLVKNYPESQYVATAQLAAGKCFYQLENWNEAQRALEPLVKSEGPARQEAAYWLGRALLRQEKPQEALALLEGTAQAIPADHAFAPHLKLARLDALYALPDRRKEAGPLYAEFAKQFAQHELAAQAQYMAALAALEQEDFAAARQHAEAFMSNAQWKSSSFMPSVLFVAAEAHLLGAEQETAGADTAKADGYYRRLVAEHAEDLRVPRSHLRIGWLLYRNEKLEEAAQYLSGIAAKLSDPEHKAEALLLIGRSRLDNGQAAEAVGQLTQSLAAKNDWSRTDEALILLAQAYRRDNKPNEAAQQLGRLESQFKQSAYRGQALYLLGEIAQEQAKYDEAAARYQAVLNEYSDDPFAAAAAYGMGAVRIAQGQYPAAEQAFTALLDKYQAADTKVLARYWRGVARHRQQKFEPATADLQQFVAEAKQSAVAAAAGKVADALYTIALCQVGQKQLPAAATTLAALLKEHPEYEHRDKAYYELGHSLLAQEKGEEAAAAFNSLVKETPASPLAAEAFFHVGSMHEQRAAGASDAAAKGKAFAEAAAAYAAGLKTASEEALKEKLQYKLGDMLFRQDDFAAASATLQSQLKAYPQGELAGPARYLSAESLFRLNQFEQALPLFEKVAADKVEPYTAQAYYRAGASAAAMKNWPASERAYRALVAQHESFPLLAEARYGLAWALQNQNQLDEAVKLYEQIDANSTTETAAKSRFMVGEIAFGKKEYDQAIAHFLKVAAGYAYPEWQGLARLEAGRCFMQMNKPAEAKKQFQIVVEQFESHPKAADAAKLLAELNK